MKKRSKAGEYLIVGGAAYLLFYFLNKKQAAGCCCCCCNQLPNTKPGTIITPTKRLTA